MAEEVAVEAGVGVPMAPPTPREATDPRAAAPEKPELTSVAWVPGRELPYVEWLRLGGRLGVAGRSVGWWLGDWLRYGSARYGSKYTAALRVTGYDRQTLMNMVYVATRFEVSRRRENLSWSHHAELAGLDIAAQERWLDRAAAERLTVRDLRVELISSRRALASERAGTSNGHVNRSGDASNQTGEWANGHVDQESAQPDPCVAADTLFTCPHCGRTFLDGAIASHADRRAAPAHA